MRTWEEQKALEKAELTKLRKAWLEPLVKSGRTRAEVAAELGTTVTALCKLCSDLDLKFGGQRARKITKADLLSAAKRGLTRRELATERGVSYATVHTACLTLKVTLKRGYNVGPKRPPAVEDESKLTPQERLMRSAQETMAATHSRWS